MAIVSVHQHMTRVSMHPHFSCLVAKIIVPAVAAASPADHRPVLETGGPVAMPWVGQVAGIPRCGIRVSGAALQSLIFYLVR